MNKKKVYLSAGVAFTTLLIILWLPTTRNVLIKSTDVKRATVDSPDRFLVFTDKGVFENTDSLTFLKFDSATVQGIVKDNVGKRIKMRVYGWRFSPYSMYENIVSVGSKNRTYSIIIELFWVVIILLIPITYYFKQRGYK